MPQLVCAKFLIVSKNNKIYDSGRKEEPAINTLTLPGYKRFALINDKVHSNGPAPLWHGLGISK